MNKTDLLSLKQTQDIDKQVPNHMKALAWSEEQLKYERQVRLRKILCYAKQHSPWYKKILKKVNVDTITEEGISELPTLNKTTLMSHWDEIVTDSQLSLTKVENHIENMVENPDNLYLLDRYHVMVTGGSSGHRGVFIYNWDAWNDYFIMLRRYRLYKDSPNILLGANRKINIAVIHSSSPVHGVFSLVNTYRSKYTNFVYFSLSMPISEIVKGLNELQPDMLQGSPFTIYRLSKEAENNFLHISPRSINLVTEPFPSSIRNALYSTWPTSKIYNTYAASEGISALNCTENREEMHLNDDMCIVEPVDASGNKVNKGTLSSKIYVTNLFNFTLPLIRYQIDDELLFLNKTCDCGVNHQLIAEPQGRPIFDFTYPNNVFVKSMIINAALLQERNVLEYQVNQILNGVDVKVLCKEKINEERLKNLLAEKLSSLGLKEPVVYLTNVEKFDYPPSGKLRRFIPMST